LTEKPKTPKKAVTPQSAARRLKSPTSGAATPRVIASPAKKASTRNLGSKDNLQRMKSPQETVKQPSRVKTPREQIPDEKLPNDGKGDELYGVEKVSKLQSNSKKPLVADSEEEEEEVSDYIASKPSTAASIQKSKPTTPAIQKPTTPAHKTAPSSPQMPISNSRG
jgi:hypothetical protein